MKLITSLLLLLSLVSASDKYTTMKTSCIQQSEHSGKTLDQQKEILINQAKQEALSELYGQLIYSKTDLKNGELISDEIRQRAVGSIRVDGNPKFYNGDNFGEVCSDVIAYITQEDLEKYSPKTVRLEKYCFNDPNVPMNKIKQEANYGAYKEIIAQYKPSLKVSNEQAEQFIHGFKISNDDFDFDTASYCFDAVATILPYEFELKPSQMKQIQTKESKKSSLKPKKVDENAEGKIYDKAYLDIYIGDEVLYQYVTYKGNGFKVVGREQNKVFDEYKKREVYNGKVIISGRIEIPKNVGMNEFLLMSNKKGKKRYNNSRHSSYYGLNVIVNGIKFSEKQRKVKALKDKNGNYYLDLKIDTWFKFEGDKKSKTLTTVKEYVDTFIFTAKPLQTKSARGGGVRVGEIPLRVYVLKDE